METLGQKILLRFGVDSEQPKSEEEELREGRGGREGENRSVELSEERGERRRGERNRGRGRRVGLEAENSPLFERPSIVNRDVSRHSYNIQDAQNAGRLELFDQTIVRRTPQLSSSSPTTSSRFLLFVPSLISRKITHLVGPL